MNGSMVAPLPALLLDFLLKSSVLLLAAGTACLLLRRASAAIRHLVWSAAIGGTLMLPLLSASLPHWDIVISRQGAARTAAAPTAATVYDASQTSKVSASATRHIAASNAAAVTSSERVPTPRTNVVAFNAAVLIEMGFLIWIIGFLSLLVQLLVGLRRVEGMKRKARHDEPGFRMAEEVSRRAGIRRPIAVLRLTMGGVGVPITWGALHPTVLLPAQTSGWSEDALRAVMLHEFAHVQRCDWPIQVTARFACALYWFHPLVWLAARQARAESERACDDCVLRAGVDAFDYAQRLVEVVRSMPEGSSIRTVAIAMAQPSEIEARLRAMLARGMERGPVTRKGLTIVAMALGLVIVPLAAVRLASSAMAASALSQDATIVTDGDSAVLPNGYEISLTGVTQAVRRGDEWDMGGGPWWSPEGAPKDPQTDVGSQSLRPLDRTQGLAPYVFSIKVRDPSRVRGKRRLPDNLDYSFYQQFAGSLQPPDQQEESVSGATGARVYRFPLADGSAPQRYECIAGTRADVLYPAGTRTCVIRCGIAAGPWRTVSMHTAKWTHDPDYPNYTWGPVSILSSSRPGAVYMPGKSYTLYYFGDDRLGNVARRFVAIDAKGRFIPLYEGPPMGAPRPPDKYARWYYPTIDLTNIKVKDFLPQTRPYQTVEFRNVQLQPTVTGHDTSNLSADLLAQTGNRQLDQAEQLRAHLLGWAQSNKALLQDMARTPSDLAAMMRVYDSFERLPSPLWDGDPRIGRGADVASFGFAVPSRLTLAHLQRSGEWIDNAMRSNFERYHDLMIAQSVNVGRVHLTLWASGRITRTTSTFLFMGHGKAMKEVESQQEIAPPFFGP